MGGLGPHFGGSGAPFWSHFGGLGGFWLPNASWKASWAALGRFSEPTWPKHGPKLGPKMEPKRRKNRCKNQSKNRCLSRSVFEAILVDFGRENGAKLAPKWDQKSMSTSKGRFYKKYWKTIKCLIIFEVFGVEVGIKH